VPPQQFCGKFASDPSMISGVEARLRRANPARRGFAKSGQITIGGARA
jgi:hypothetical protein